MNPKNISQNNENSLASDNINNDTEVRTLSLLQKIRVGDIVPKSIKVAERHLIVIYLMADGYCTAEIAQILNVSDRTIERDKKAIREDNSIETNPHLIEQIVGRLVNEAELSIQKIRKAARDTDTPPAVKVDAEHRCFQIVNEMTKSLQSLGYLPSASTKLHAEITHSIGQIPELSEIEFEYKRLKQITDETQDTNSQVTEQLNQIQIQLVKAKLVNQIDNISNIVESKEVQNESDQ